MNTFFKVLCRVYWKDKVGSNKYGINSFQHFNVKGGQAWYFKLFADVCLHQLNTACTGTTHKD